ncbi:MAG: CxxC-x17-CxxC domain-containing protein [Chloroflexota bacterium]
MTFEDKTLQCFDCGANFIFSVEEQEAFHAKGYANAPKRCPSCRQVRKERQEQQGNNHRNNGVPYRSQRQMFPAVCARCGKNTEVPFEPHEGRPVYCRDCYSAVRVSR